MTLNTYTHIVDDMNKNTAQLLDKIVKRKSVTFLSKIKAESK